MIILTKDEWCKLLQREYVDNRKLMCVIADELGCSAPTIHRHLRSAGIKIRKRNEWRIGEKLSEQTKRKIATRMRGKRYSKETRRKVSLAASKHRWAESQREKFSKSYKSNPANYGKKPWNWQGKSPESERLRKSIRYRDWRLVVFNRDGFACVGCGDNRGRNLQAHHILSFSEYPNLRFDVSNGVTLCKKCHRKMHPDIAFVGLGA